LLDANLATTQGSTVDTFALTVAIASGTVGTLAAASATAANLTDGVHANAYTNSVTAASTSTLTATPQGTWWSWC
jgi:H+/gluconate symporter-like permease